MVHTHSKHRASTGGRGVSGTHTQQAQSKHERAGGEWHTRTASTEQARAGGGVSGTHAQQAQSKHGQAGGEWYTRTASTEQARAGGG